MGKEYEVDNNFKIFASSVKFKSKAISNLVFPDSLLISVSLFYLIIINNRMFHKHIQNILLACLINFNHFVT